MLRVDCAFIVAQLKGLTHLTSKTHDGTEVSMFIMTIVTSMTIIIITRHMFTFIAVQLCATFPFMQFLYLLQPTAKN